LHISDEILEKYYLDPASFSEEDKNSILKHLDNCSECCERFILIIEFSNEIAVKSEEKATINDGNLALRIKHKLDNLDEAKLLPEKTNSVEIYNGRTEIINKTDIYSLQNIYRFFKNYPFTSFSFAAVCVLASAFLVSTIKTNLKDTNPVFAEVKNSVLFLYNKGGEVYLKTMADGIKPIKSDSVANITKGKVQNIILADINDDNKNEILLFGSKGMKGSFTHDTLYCLDNNANLVWKSALAPKIEFNSLKWHLTKWNLHSASVISHKGSKKIIATASDNVYAASVVMDIDPKTGKVLQTFYLPGHIVGQIHYDINGDNNDELVVCSFNNALRRVSLAVFNLDNIAGFAPATDFFYPAKYYKGSQLYYILFPWTEHGKKLAKTNFNGLESMEGAGNDELIVLTLENNGIDLTKESGFGLLFNFDKNFFAKSIIGSVVYVKTYEELYKKGVYKQPLDSAYYNSVRDSIKYWDGDKFVNYPKKNKYWNQKFQMP